jgi:hypothetical protein
MREGSSFSRARRVRLGSNSQAGALADHNAVKFILRRNLRDTNRPVAAYDELQ